VKHDLSLSSFGATVAELISAARLAEAEDFDAVWTYDHVSGNAANAGWVLDPWVTLTAIAAATKRIHLGPLVLNATLRHPAHIAVASATLQQASGGRLMVGMGAGAGHDRFGAEVEMIGLPQLSAADRRDRTEEAVTTVRALWRGTSDLHGAHHSLNDATGFFRPDPEPIIVVGINGPKMSALAGRVGDAVNIHGVEEQLEDLADIAREASENPHFPITVEAPLTPRWLDGDGYQRLVDIGVTRVMYQWSIRHGHHAITAAAELLRQART
jgi:alkanesulfonate monooxygenase SsuD/methylene tetrahydromethanopterin reductase-like flavin-dependent oxidoreductase (luciferase family)